jgi:hypothetical protein
MTITATLTARNERTLTVYGTITQIYDYVEWLNYSIESRDNHFRLETIDPSADQCPDDAIDIAWELADNCAYDLARAQDHYATQSGQFETLPFQTWKTGIGSSRISGVPVKHESDDYTAWHVYPVTTAREALVLAKQSYLDCMCDDAETEWITAYDHAIIEATAY